MKNRLEEIIDTQGSFMEDVEKIKKHIRILQRTKTKRIKNKQISKILKIIENNQDINSKIILEIKSTF